MTSQLKRLESEQVELLKGFDISLADMENHLAQNKRAPDKEAYRCFVETYYELEKNRQQQRQLLKLKHLENCYADTERKVGEKKETFKWLVEQ